MTVDLWQAAARKRGSTDSVFRDRGAAFEWLYGESGGIANSPASPDHFESAVVLAPRFS